MSTDTKAGFTCPACDYDIDGVDMSTDEGRDDAINSGKVEWSNVKEVWVCYGCYESDSTYASKISVWGPGAVDDYGMDRGCYYVGDITKMNQWGDEPDIEFVKTYTASSAWRGYSSISAEGYTDAVSGCMLWGQPTRESDVVEYIAENEETLPVQVLIAYSVTSNVFSQIIDVLVKDDDVEAFRAWIAEAPVKESSW
jgi:hypothetical protein